MKKYKEYKEHTKSVDKNVEKEIEKIEHICQNMREEKSITKENLKNWDT